jgi:hypothetical protein
MAVHKAYLIFFRIRPQYIRVERIIHSARNVKRAYRSKS